MFYVQILDPQYYGGLSEMHFEIKLGMYYDRVSSQAGHKEW